MLLSVGRKMENLVFDKYKHLENKPHLAISIYPFYWKTSKEGIFIYLSENAEDCWETKKLHRSSLATNY